MKSLLLRLAAVLALALGASAAAAADWTGCLMSDYASEACIHSPDAIAATPAVVAEVDLMDLESGEVEFPGDAPEYALARHKADGANFDDLPARESVHVALLLPGER